MTSGEHEVFLESSVRGYHAYFKYSTVSVGELMMWEIEENIDHDKYSKIPKISPGDYTFQRPFLRGLFLEGLIFGGAYLRREICVSKSIGLAL